MIEVAVAFAWFSLSALLFTPDVADQSVWFELASIGWLGKAAILCLIAAVAILLDKSGWSFLTNDQSKKNPQ